jgi:pyridinium-3,5-bisthiocarboxylic acid mononucleotide nickel chelatase
MAEATGEPGRQDGVTVLAYFDCYSGISGDMALGAMVDAGVQADALREGLAALPLTGWHLEVERVAQRGLAGTRVHVVVESEVNVGDKERHLADIEALINAAELPVRVRERAVSVFRRLAEAEARVHGEAIDEVHFHEVGAVDAIVDIVGSALGLEMLGVDTMYCSGLPLTGGRVQSAHGVLPVPAPATLELLRGTGALWRPVDAEGELVTPTGAAIVATLAQFRLPALRVQQIGHGFGERELPWANCVRLLLGEAPLEADGHAAGFETDAVTVIEANIDNMTGEALGWLMERVLAAGALDVSFGPLHMKKNRPGTRLTVLAEPRAAEALAAMVLRDSATLGVRMSEMRRLKADRRLERIGTPLGEAAVKLKVIGGTVVSVAAEFEEASALAAQYGVPLATVVAQIEAAGRARFGLDAQVDAGPVADQGRGLGRDQRTD